MLTCNYCEDNYSNVPNADSHGYRCDVCHRWFCTEDCRDEHLKDMSQFVSEF